MDFDNDQPLNATANASGNPNPAAAARRILVVDDESAMRNLISGALVQSGYAVDSARDGAEAWETLQDQHYDLLITDNNMPRVSGVELLEKLHASANFVPVILSTGVAPEDEFNRRPWLRPKATLIKPFAIAELRETVERILSEPLEPSQRANIYVT